MAPDLGHYFHGQHRLQPHFGFVGDKVGWRNTIIWFGGVGCGITTLLFYYSPQFSAGNFWVVMAAGVLWGALLAGYVPLSALMPSLVKRTRGQPFPC